MKKCIKCGETDKTKFYARKYACYCKECQKDYSRKYHEDNRAVATKQNRTRLERYRERNNFFICEYLLEHPCVDCGETDIVVLEFDHVGNKVENVSLLVGRARSINIIKAEMDKCEVVCANCHRRRTAERADQFKWRYVNASS